MYNIGDVVRINMKHINTNRIAIVLEPFYIGQTQKQSVYTYKVLICGVEIPCWIREDEITGLIE